MTILDPRNSLVGAWHDYEVIVINQRREIHPELRAEAREAFIGGASAMFRIFTEKISQITDQQKQTAAVNEIGEEIRSMAIKYGRH